MYDAAEKRSQTNDPRAVFWDHHNRSDNNDKSTTTTRARGAVQRTGVREIEIPCVIIWYLRRIHVIGPEIQTHTPNAGGLLGSQ